MIDLDLFFANELYNSCQATDGLIKNIEESQDEALARRALALYQHHYSTLERPWNHGTFMYGLGLIYMHFNAYNLAIKAFREAIYVQPSFPRSRDVHTRLGLIFKATGRHKLSEKHFKLAINDTRPDSGASTKLELEFQLAHLYEAQGRLKQAKEAYERLLQEKDLPHQLSANIHRQLGWMFFYNDNDASPRNNSRKQNMFNHQNVLSNGRIDAALNYLNTSYRTDSDPKTSYYLGRCFTNIGKFRDAFASYRSVIDREESTADTWCSIGVLYHRQNQPTDALQAYIRSVQFDKRHAVAWMNLGILYESHNQFHDALKCYQHALRSSANGVDRSLKARIRYIQKQMSDIETSLSNNGTSRVNSDKLLSLEDLWNLESKTNSESSATATSSSSKLPITSQATTKSTIYSPSQSNPILLKPIVHSETQANKDQSNTDLLNNNSLHKDASPSNNCANKTETSTPLLDQDSKSKCLSGVNKFHPSTPTGDPIGLLKDCKVEIPIQVGQDFKPKSLDSKDFSLNQVLTNGASKDSGISSNSSTYTDCALVSSQNVAKHLTSEQVIEAYRNSLKLRKFDINLLSDETTPPRLFPRTPPYPPLPSDKLFPSPPSIFPESKKELASKKLQDYCHLNPIMIVRNMASVLKLDLGLFSTKTLVESNPDHPVNILSHPLYQNNENSNEEQSGNKWACELLKSTSTIASFASYQVASFRESLQEERESKPGVSKASLTKESETDSNESVSASSKRANNNQSSNQFVYEGAQNNQASNSSYRSPLAKRFKKEQSPRLKFVKSAYKIDLSDDKKWRSQLNELNKLPNFIKCVSASNMLTHVGSPIPGINTTVMSMHVPGCRILGNGTPNNFCSVSINVGPGDYEWYAISPEYLSVLTRLCNRNGFELDEKNWWPKMSDLQKYNVPIYRFSQRPGDLVWVNSGTIYWVQSVGWCNSINWNIGPLNAHQYKSASESFELNKLIFRKSDVPMIQLTWNLVININIIPDDGLYHPVVEVLKRSLGFSISVGDLIEQSKQKIDLLHGELGPKTAKYCSLCECEVFNITFTRKHDDCLHCVECARRVHSTFDGYQIEQDYDLKYLMKLYDDFIETRRKFQSRQQQLRQDQ